MAMLPIRERRCTWSPPFLDRSIGSRAAPFSPLRKKQESFLFGDFSDAGGGRFGCKHHGAKTPLFAGLDDSDVILGDADLVAGAVKKVEFETNTKPLLIGFVAERADCVNQVATGRLLESDG